MRARPPRAVVTCARGSSDHAATFAKYLVETRTGVLTSSAALSVSSVYAAQQDLGDVLYLAISQSGKSPDLLAAVQAAKTAGAFVIALVNDTTSPLAALADEVLPLHAGPELSVAATKSYIAALSAIAQLVAAWTERRGPDRRPVHAARPAGRGLDPGLDPGRRAPEAGPQPLCAGSRRRLRRRPGGGPEVQGDLRPARRGLQRRRGAARPDGVGEGRLPRAGLRPERREPRQRRRHGQGRGRAGRRRPAGRRRRDGAGVLPALAAHPVIEPILMIQSFYRMANALSVARGYDPDSPPHLNKVTETV